VTTKLRRTSPNPHRRYKPVFRPDKFRELVLYHADRALQADEATYDPVKLQKLLWITDMVSYGTLGASMTGATYIRKIRGPVASEFLPQAVVLEREKALAFQKVVRDGRTIERAVALKPADILKFSQQEVQIADQALALFGKVESPTISEWSHGLRGWRHSRIDEEIPYESIFLEDDPPPAGLIDYANQVVIENHESWEAKASPHASSA